LQIRIRSDFLPTKENGKLAILYVPTLVALIVLMGLQIAVTWKSMRLSGTDNWALLTAIWLIIIKSVVLVIKFCKLEVKDSVMAFFSKEGGVNSVCAVIIWSLVMFVWVPAILVLFYPFILLWYSLKNIFFIITCRGNSALDPEDRKGIKCCVTTFHVLKVLIGKTLREAKISFGQFTLFKCCKEVELHDKYGLFRYNTQAELDKHVEHLY